jgi:hypothetical protein
MFVFWGLGYGQNLVGNASFEDTVNCPFQSGDIEKAVGWTSFCGSPDYFKSCNEYDWGVPTNIFGHQLAASGNSYSGFISYYSGQTNLREFPACQLSSPLNIGERYYISFKVALSLENIANPTNCATNNIGAMFMTVPYICDNLINNNPPVYASNTITDSTKWTSITGSFIADSAYMYLVIGNFFDDAQTDTIKFFESWWDDFAYYYLDDVCLGTDSSYVYGFDSFASIQQNSLSSKISFFPNPVNDYLFIKNNSNQAIEISIYDLLGKEMINIENSSSKSFYSNLNNIPSGMLIINIKSNNQSTNFKLQKL